jgi:membrane associated rhomboid family serine protease
MVLPGKQPGLLVAVIVPAFLSTLVVIARSMRKVKRRPDHISKAGAFAAETLLIASVASGWISGIFVIISIHYGFGRHQADILAEPNGMQSLINAAFWQTTGYCE